MSGELEDNQLLFNGRMNIIHKGGTETVSDKSLKIADSDDILIYMSAATNYKQDYPKYRTGETMNDIQQKVKQTVDKAEDLGYEKVKDEHVKDHKSLFDRTRLDIGQKPSDVPFNELLDLYKNGKATKEQSRIIEAILFQYGRYLLIGSSRANSALPANLQGVWNDQNVPMWRSDYHLNVNLQMNYWLAPITDLAECEMPLFDYVEGLRKPGRLTTTIYTGINETEEIKEFGFMAHVANTPYGLTGPGIVFEWGWSPGTAPWILTNLYDYYEFTKDENILKNKLYPMLREETIMYQRLAKPENKTARKLVVSPAISPEQTPRTNGCAFESHMMWKLFNMTIETAEKFGFDQDKVAKWRETMSQIRGPIEIGESGQIKEWHNEGKLGTMGEKNHRHMSHLLAFYPMNMMSIDTPDYLAATIVSLIDRGDIATGWAMTQRVCTWARVGDGEKSFSVLQKFIKNRVYSNMFEFCPPFQIDGNFGVTAAIAEMLLQSHLDSILLLPALPSAWDTGSFDGLIGRGNFQFNISWVNMKLKKVSVKSRSGNKLRLRYPGISKATTNSNIDIRKINEDEIEFDTKINEVYIFENFVNINRFKGLKKATSKRISNNQVLITWNNDENAESYNIFRQIGDIKPIMIAKNILECHYIDNNNYIAECIPDSKYYYEPCSLEIRSNEKSHALKSFERVKKIPANSSKTTHTLTISIIIIFAILLSAIAAIIIMKAKKIKENSYEQIEVE